MKKNLIITDYRGFLRRRRTKDESLDVLKIKGILEKGGYKFDVVSFEDIAQNYKYYSSVENSFIIYSASKHQEYNKYIDHVIYLLGKKNYLVPKYELFKAYDDKGFQELYKSYLGIESLKYKYLSNRETFTQIKNDIIFPVVMKEMVSASSIGVHKVNDAKDTIQKIEEIAVKEKKGQKYTLKSNVKKLFKKETKDYDGVLRFVLQEFVPNLKEDWKVLIFGEKYYVLNRKVRKNDFRASGSGEFVYLVPPNEILDKAKEVFSNISTPFISLDLAFDGKEAYVIELQALNFGPITLINSPFYFTNSNGYWQKIDKKSDLDEEYGNAYLWFLNKISESEF